MQNPIISVGIHLIGARIHLTDFAMSSSWSCWFTVLTNRKLL